MKENKKNTYDNDLDDEWLELDEEEDYEELLETEDDSIEDQTLTHSASQPIDYDDEDSPPLSKKYSERKRSPLNLHIILIAAIVLIAGIAIFRLVRWNKGVDINELNAGLEDIDPSEFDVETLDMIIPMDASAFEGREDDGVTTILCLGNNPFTDDRSDTGLCSLIADKTDSVVYNCAFPDSSAACKYPTYNPEYTRDHFNLYYVVECFRNNEFTAINSIAGDEPDPRYMESVNEMKTVDMDKVDVILIMYDSTDYNVGTPSDNPDNPHDVTAFTGGLRTTINNIKSTWPYIRILVMSHTYAQYQDEDGKLQNGTITDLGNGTLNHYLIKESEAVLDCGVSFIDNYYGTINEGNYEEYMTDYMHYNEAGREKIADRVADIINNRMDVVNSSTAG